ncbi:MAG: hypothetical protein PWQ77_202 [Kosmotogales bacterium]|nr:hypothetical protein [Kosmotogales bacterium]
MKLTEVVEYLGCKVLNKTPDYNNIIIESVGTADLMSDVLVFGKPGMLLITGLNSPQCVRTASVVGASAVLIVRKLSVQDATIQLAAALEVPLLHLTSSTYKTCGLLYKLGLQDSRGESL